MTAESFPPSQPISASPNEFPNCHASMRPEIYAWQDTEVWVLDFRDHPEEIGEKYNALPPTFDHDEHLRNMKAIGAVWYADPMEHEGAAAMRVQREELFDFGSRNDAALVMDRDGEEHGGRGAGPRSEDVGAEIGRDASATGGDREIGAVAGGHREDGSNAVAKSK